MCGSEKLWPFSEDDTQRQRATEDSCQIPFRGAIESARVAVLLISATFMASDFIQEKELPKRMTTLCL
jgi:hypothetical protein